MKKIYIYSTIVLVASLCFASCEKDPVVSKNGTYVYEAYNDSETKTTLSGVVVNWCSTDEVTGFNTSHENIPSTSTAIAEGVASFSFDKEVSCALYPKDNNATYTGTYIYTTLKSLQGLKVNSFGDNANLTVASAPSGGKLSFKNMGAFLSVDVKNDNIKGIRISADETMTGDVKISHTASTMVSNTASGMTNNDYVEMAGDFSNGNSYYFVVLPGTYNNMKITFVNNLGQTVTYTKKTSMTLTRNQNEQFFAGTISKEWSYPAYTIDFAHAVTNSASSISTSTGSSTIITSGNEYVMSKPVSSVEYGYYGNTADAIRLGQSSKAGSIKLSLSDAGSVYATKVVVKAQANKESTTLSVNDCTPVDITTDVAEYTFTLDGSKITSIKLDASKYTYINSVTVTYKEVIE